jgi:hypothetical protein
MQAGAGETVKLSEFKVVQICGIFLGIPFGRLFRSLSWSDLPRNPSFGAGPWTPVSFPALTFGLPMTEEGICAAPFCEGTGDGFGYGEVVNPASATNKNFFREGLM